MLGKYLLAVVVTFPVLADTVPTGRPVTPWIILREGLSDGNTDHRRQAVLAAASIGDTPDGLKFIQEAFRDKEIIVRQTAALVLGQMKATASIPALQTALDDRSIEVSFTAARSLAGMDDRMGRLFLEQVLTGQRKDKPGFLDWNLKKAKRQL